jgi:hypothetical protein
MSIGSWKLAVAMVVLADYEKAWGATGLIAGLLGWESVFRIGELRFCFFLLCHRPTRPVSEKCPSEKK